MKERYFRFKQFGVRHDKAPMKVGVDGVLLGAWAYANGLSVLDVGTGCGLIALMMAQRNPTALILGIDVHEQAIEEARQNAFDTEWTDRLYFENHSFEEQVKLGDRFDVVVSNPPFFHAGVSGDLDQRQTSRHAAQLSPESLLISAEKILNPEGRLAMITPRDQLQTLLSVAAENNLKPARLTEVTTVEGKAAKRLLSEWMLNDIPGSAGLDKGANDVKIETLYIEKGEPGKRVFSAEYKALCSPFYLDF